MFAETFKFTSKLTKWSEGKGAWHFLSVPAGAAKDINALFGDLKRGWGSLPVKVQIAATSWETSIFTDKKSGTYLLPVKSDIRKAVGLAEGDSIELAITISR